MRTRAASIPPDADKGPWLLSLPTVSEPGRSSLGRATWEGVTSECELSADVPRSWSWKRPGCRGSLSRINLYYKKTVLDTIHETLLLIGGATLLNHFREGCFGPLLRWIGGKSSCKALHELLAHEIKIPGAPEDEFWFHVSGQHLRFSCVEYALVTGFLFGSSDFDPTATHDVSQIQVYRDFCNGQHMSLKTLLYIFSKQLIKDETGEGYLKVANILALYFFALGYGEGRFVDSFVWALVDDLTAWDRFPWGAYTYQAFVHYMSILPTTRRACGEKYHFYGPSWALQIWSYEAIPHLGSKVGRRVIPSAHPRFARWSFVFSTMDFTGFFEQELLNQRCQTCLLPDEHEKSTMYWNSVQASNPVSVRYIRLRKVSNPCGAQDVSLVRVNDSGHTTSLRRRSRRSGISDHSDSMSSDDAAEKLDKLRRRRGYLHRMGTTQSCKTRNEDAMDSLKRIRKRGIRVREPKYTSTDADERGSKRDHPLRKERRPAANSLSRSADEHAGNVRNKATDPGSRNNRRVTTPYGSSDESDRPTKRRKLIKLGEALMAWLEFVSKNDDSIRGENVPSTAKRSHHRTRTSRPNPHRRLSAESIHGHAMYRTKDPDTSGVAAHQFAPVQEHECENGPSGFDPALPEEHCDLNTGPMPTAEGKQTGHTKEKGSTGVADEPYAAVHPLEVYFSSTNHPGTDAVSESMGEDGGIQTDEADIINEQSAGRTVVHGEDEHESVCVVSAPSPVDEHSNEQLARDLVDHVARTVVSDAGADNNCSVNEGSCAAAGEMSAVPDRHESSIDGAKVVVSAVDSSQNVDGPREVHRNLNEDSPSVAVEPNIDHEVASHCRLNDIASPYDHAAGVMMKHPRPAAEEVPYVEEPSDNVDGAMESPCNLNDGCTVVDPDKAVDGEVETHCHPTDKGSPYARTVQGSGECIPITLHPRAHLKSDVEPEARPVIKVMEAPSHPREPPGPGLPVAQYTVDKSTTHCEHTDQSSVDEHINQYAGAEVPITFDAPKQAGSAAGSPCKFVAAVIIEGESRELHSPDLSLIQAVVSKNEPVVRCRRSARTRKSPGLGSSNFLSVHPPCIAKAVPSDYAYFHSKGSDCRLTLQYPRCTLEQSFFDKVEDVDCNFDQQTVDLFLESMRSLLVTGGNILQPEVNNQNTRLCSSQLFVITVCQIDGHFVTVHISVRELRVVLYDSLSLCSTDEDRRAHGDQLKPLLMLLERLMFVAGYWDKNRCSMRRPRTLAGRTFQLELGDDSEQYQQRESHTSGPFACMVVERLINGGPAPYWGSITSNMRRYRLRDKLCDRALASRGGNVNHAIRRKVALQLVGSDRNHHTTLRWLNAVELVSDGTVNIRRHFNYACNNRYSMWQSPAATLSNLPEIENHVKNQTIAKFMLLELWFLKRVKHQKHSKFVCTRVFHREYKGPEKGYKHQCCILKNYEASGSLRSNCRSQPLMAPPSARVHNPVANLRISRNNAFAASGTGCRSAAILLQFYMVYELGMFCSVYWLTEPNNFFHTASSLWIFCVDVHMPPRHSVSVLVLTLYSVVGTNYPGGAFASTSNNWTSSKNNTTLPNVHGLWYCVRGFTDYPMNPYKRNCDMVDRLSALPDPLILMILSLLPTRDVVRTSIISRRWKYLWITIPCLSFCKLSRDTIEARNFIQRTLLLWRGTYIREFQIRFGREFDAALHGDLDLWILLAKTMKVEELTVHLPNDYSRPAVKYPVYRPPSCLYGVQSLKSAPLIGFCLENVRMVQWDRLRSLLLVGARFSEDVLIKVLAGCPQLSQLRLAYFGRHHNMTIRSNSLRELYVHCHKYSASNNTLLTISAPNLVEFEFSGAPHTVSVLADVPSLRVAGLHYGPKSATTICGALCQIMPSLATVGNIQLSHWCFKITGAVGDPKSLLVLQKKFPNMDTLIIHWDSSMDKPNVNAPFNLQLDPFESSRTETTNIRSLQFLLTRVEISCHRLEDSIRHLMEYILEHAASLEKMVIGVRTSGSEMVEDGDFLQAASKVLMLQKRYPTIEFVLRRSLER
ncbi:hypothetical protein C2S51_020651 [Perilla frutescens var. frutescens]|nr:hypothetical protein C2S51_020651 [Perilla frutescens var. frutescens]